MRRYDPNRPPVPEAWLALTEHRRLALIVDYHRQHAPGLPSVRAHAAFHVIVENQLAMGVPSVVDALRRLRQEGLSRHEAIHAIASVLSEQIFTIAKEQQPASEDINKVYEERLRTLTVKRWYDDYG